MEMVTMPNPTLRMMGTGTWAGGVYRNVSVMGDGEIEGDLESPTFRVMGEVVVTGDVRAGRARIMGTCRARGVWRGTSLTLLGELTVDGDCSVDRFSSRGAFTIAGLLSADTVSIRLRGPSSAREIGGETIRVRCWPRTATKSGLHQLTADVIEGDEIFLESTIAKVVRGKRVVVGRGCQIDVVEYEQAFTRRAGAIVAVERKV